jgi:alpha-L-arabinofuranosidase
MGYIQFSCGACQAGLVEALVSNIAFQYKSATQEEFHSSKTAWLNIEIIIIKTQTSLKRILLIGFLLASLSCEATAQDEVLNIYIDSIVADVSRHPVGINLDYFMDGNRFPHPQRSVADALKAMGVKYLRYPGGDKSDLNLFSVPPYNKSQPTLARTGKGAVDDYVEILQDYKAFKYDVLDFDEYMTLCRQLNAEPVVVVPADSYLKKYPPGCTWTSREDLIKNAVEWVRYSNIKKKYRVKYWMIGNECWHENNKNSTAEIYAHDVLDFAKAMKAVDPSIAIIPNGNAVDYFGTVIKTAGDYIDYLCLSNYPVFNYYGGYKTYKDTLQNLTEPVDRAVAALEKYATREQKKKIKLIVAEYGPFDWGNKWPHINDMGHTLANFEMTGDQLLRPEIEFSCFWNTRWIDNDSIPNQVWDAIDKNCNYNAIGYSLMIWGNYLGDKMIKTTSSIHMRSFASLKSSEKKLFVYLLNKDEKSRNVQLNIQNKKIRSVVQAWELVGKNSDDLHPVWEKFTVGNEPNQVQLKGISITVIEYQLE